MSKIFKTTKGVIKGRAPTDLELANLKNALPLGLLMPDSSDDDQIYGLVTKCGDDEAWALKQQNPDISPSSFKAYLTSYYYLMCRSVCEYLKHGFGGCLVPSFYRKEKGDRLEFGFSFSGSPSPTGRESNEFPPMPPYDENFGEGFFTMYKHFYDGLKKISKEDGFPFSPVIGLDIRKTGALGQLVVLLIVHGKTVFVCKRDLVDDDMMLSILADGGVEGFVHLPCLPMETEPSNKGVN